VPWCSVELGAVDDSRRILLRSHTISIMAISVHQDTVTVPDADEAFIREHRDEILELAAKFGIHDVKYAGGNRLVGTVVRIGVMLPTYAFMEAAEENLGREILLFCQKYADWQPEGSDFRQARPL
jgi:sugar phosphate isomerase/epimerase